MSVSSLLAALLGLNRAGRILYIVLFVLAVPAILVWFVILPRFQFSDADERLFRAARHGDFAGVDQSLAAGGRIDAAAPIDGKTAIFRAAVFGHADLVRYLLKQGADLGVRGTDGKTVLEVVDAARSEERDAARLRALDAVAVALRAREPQR
ncbi:ankyrin repeat domain-containing protein [Propionivibrio sp.]|uniref:ankyrin repeat domain-containing protein n=1 Tax=Propionivibrio sp. TaxID=2212460 RepID=UPI002600F6D9|nr:ankyrin repeat domain-containing protein [Propionivibrio sp.]MBK7354484.1 ankyrin repeat domain-containing protein [Propionivibrio sp.]MBK8745145.1 ankyrin repeat domain-containing protein [Propionivibrio sp.]